MRLARRRYRGDEDNWRIRAFLHQVHLLTGHHEVCWPVYRWDCWRWRLSGQVFQVSLEAAVFLWETDDGQLAAVLHPNGPGEAVMQVHPAFRSPELEVELMTTAETQYALCQSGGQRLALWVHERDTLRQDLLARRGYRRCRPAEYHFRRSMEQPPPGFLPPAGYSVRPRAGELPAAGWLRCHMVQAGGPEEVISSWEGFRSIQHAPLYRADLDLVAVAPDGEVAACCTFWLDEATGTASIEPVATFPAHRRKGLAKAIVTDGLRRAQRLGATLCTASSTSEAAPGLYTALGFGGRTLSEPWSKTW